MKSDVIHISSSGTGIAEALKQTQAVAVFKSLSEKDSIRLLLLAEEATGMIKALTGEVEADFWIETNADTFELHVCTDTSMSFAKREKLLSVSSDGKNATKGFMAKIRSIFEATVGAMGSSYVDAIGAGFVESGGNVGASYWTLTQYKKNAKNEEWDELERSIVARLADEVKVCISGSNVEMTIEKKF